MRLRKTMKRTAAAALALSMAVSATMPASAGIIIDMSKVKGDVTITKDEDDLTIKVTTADGTEMTYDDGGEEVDGITYDDDDDAEITITGNNTKTAETEDGTETLEAPEAEEPEVEEPAVDDEKLAATPTTLEFVAPIVDLGDTDIETDFKEPERTVTETEYGTVITYDDYDVDPDIQVTKPEESTVPATEEKEKDKDDKDTVTYEAENKSPVGKVANAVVDTIRNVIKIINNSSEELDVTLKNLFVDAGKTNKNALTIEGTYDVLLSVEGQNEMIGGSGLDESGKAADGLNASKLDADEDDAYALLHIDGDGSLTARGGSAYADDIDQKGTVSGGDGIHANEMEIINVELTAIGGDAENDNTEDEDAPGRAIGGAGIWTDSDLLLYSEVAVLGEEEVKTVTAKGGNAKSACKKANGEDNPADAQGGDGINVAGVFDNMLSKVEATGGNAESTEGIAAGGSGINVSGDFGVHDMGSTGEAKSYVTATGGSASAAQESAIVRGGHGLSTDIFTIFLRRAWLSIKGGDVKGSGKGVAGDGWYITDTDRENPYPDDERYICAAKTEITLTGGNATATGAQSDMTAGYGMHYEYINDHDPYDITMEESTFAASSGTASAEGAAAGSATLKSSAPIASNKQMTWSLDEDTKMTLEYKENYVKSDDDVAQTLTGNKAEITLPDGENLSNLGIINSNEDTVQIFEKDENGAAKLAGEIKNGKTYKMTLKDATCSQNGKLVFTNIDDAADFYERDDPNASATGRHSFTVTVEGTAKPATCTEKGKEASKKCENCEAVQEGAEIETLGGDGQHHFTDVVEVVAPTYESEGYTVYKCKNCDETETRDFVPMLVPETGSSSTIDIGFSMTGSDSQLLQIGSILYIEAKAEDTAAIEGILRDLSDLIDKGIETIVFSTSQKTSTIHLAEVVALGNAETPFTLTHDGASAALTVGGVEHNECIH